MLFTRCPDCETTFRITAEALRKADGQVRCGRCARVFNAYHELRRRARRKVGTKPEDAPSTPASGARPAGESVAVSGAKPAGAAHIEGGKGISGPVMHAEGRTSVESLAVHVEAHKAAEGPAVHAEAVKPVEAASVPSPSAPPSPAPPGPSAVAKPTGAVAHVQPGHTAAADRSDARTIEKAAARGKRTQPPKAAIKVTPDEKDTVLGDISLASIMAELDASAAPEEADAADAARADAPGTDVSAITLLAKNGLSVPAKVPAAVAVPQAPKASAPAADAAAQVPAWVILDEAPPKQPATRLWSLGCIAAAALFALQALHHYRAHIAVLAGIGPIVRQAYAMLDTDLAPAWDLDQYEIEIDWDAVSQPSASGGPGNLKIAARIRNKGPREVPLPHVQVELKDRWESTIGSRVFAPSEYLPRGARLDRLMIEGQTMLAQLEIVDPGTEAYGFELDVCVEAAAGTLRCAADAVFR